MNSIVLLSGGLDSAVASRQAAVEIQRVSATQRQQVLAYLRNCWDRGATDEEIQIALNLNPSSQRPRRIELERLGQVHGRGVTRKTRSGRAAQVWFYGRDSNGQMEMFNG